MNQATHAPFEGTYQTTNAWLKELMEELDGRTGIGLTARCGRSCTPCATA